jgi:hypothetical protein
LPAQGLPAQGLQAQGVPGGPGGPGVPGQWYGPPAGPVKRKRPRWLLPVGGTAVILVVVVALVLGLSSGSGSHNNGATQSPSVTPTQTHRASPTPSATPTVGNLTLAQLQVGDCLTGANLDLNLNTPWPKLSDAVPCTQAHTAEVFLANENYWARGGAYPGDTAIKTKATAGCNSAFQSYVGIQYQKSIYTWTDIVPDASTWPTGDRALHCVVYYATSSQPAGVKLYASVKGAAK